MAADPMYQSGIHLRTDGNLYVSTGHKIEIETGGDISVNGDSLVAEVAALTGLDSGELGVLNAVSAGTAAASKAVVLGSAKEIATLGAVTMGALTATTITGTDDVSITKTITSATPSTDRLVHSAITVTPATTAAIGSNGSLAGVRGSVTLTTGKSLTDGYLYGVQGKVIATGATIAVGSDHIAGVLGQLDIAGTMTSGHIAAVIGSIQGTPTSSNVDLFYGESATGNVINAMFKAFAKADYVFDLESNVHTQMSTSGTAGSTAAKGWLKVKVEGLDRYIPLTDSVS